MYQSVLDKAKTTMRKKRLVSTRRITLKMCLKRWKHIVGSVVHWMRFQKFKVGESKLILSTGWAERKLQPQRAWAWVQSTKALSAGYGRWKNIFYRISIYALSNAHNLSWLIRGTFFLDIPGEGWTGWNNNCLMTDQTNTACFPPSLRAELARSANMTKWAAHTRCPFVYPGDD